MGIIHELRGMMKQEALTLFERKQETGDIHTFRFSAPSTLQWKAGQHGIFIITHRKIKKGIHPFSIASSPSENCIQITTRIPVSHASDFKQALSELQPGMSIGFRGPAGSMHIDNPSHLILIAAGLGITPFRAVLRDMADNKALKGIHSELIHYDKDKTSLFSDEWPVQSSAITLILSHPASRVEFEQMISHASEKHGNQAFYFLSGPAGMTKKLSSLLRKNGITRKHIRKDLFFGQQS